MPFCFTKLSIPEVILVESKSFPDERGYFLEIFKESDLIKNGINSRFLQDNFSHSKKDVLRGLHFQKSPKSQAKLVSVTRGTIFDVAVDIRKNSPTYRRWIGETLSDKNHKMLYIPEGFAHGFCVVSEEADVLYKVSQEYSPEHEKGIIWNDPDINITWPIEKPILHEKDQLLPFLKDTDNNFTN